jgi:hypothetical protein
MNTNKWLQVISLLIEIGLVVKNKRRKKDADDK